MTRMHPDRMLVSPDIANMATLYRQYSPAIFAYLSQHVPQEEDAEDILVAVFLAALENERFSTLPEKMQLAWLWRVAHNKTIDAYRRRERRYGRNVTLESIAESVADDGDLEPEPATLRQEEYEVLRGYIENLSAQQQEVLRLRFGQDMRCSEIAAHLGKREGAVKVMLSRTLNLLKGIYKARGEE